MDDIKAAVRGQNRLILLAHDSRDKYETVKALPDIIEFLQEEGYTFAALIKRFSPLCLPMHVSAIDLMCVRWAH